MSPRTMFLAKVIGLFLLCMAASLVLNKASMLAALAATVREPEILLAYSIVFLLVGLAMVIGHSVWSGPTTAIIVTLLGWAILMKSLLLLFVPSGVMVSLYGLVRFADFSSVYAAVIAVIGLYLAYRGFRAPRTTR
jgi:uncharacterized membrane protein